MCPELQFDEDGYLSAYTDVAQAVRAGHYRDGLHHFQLHGQSEGRIGRHKQRYQARKLDEFVVAVDAAGGLGATGTKPILDSFALSFDTPVDLNLDPYSETYVAAQISLYEEISGRKLDQSANELTSFDLDAHTRAANPYGWRDPSALVLHHLRIGKAIKEAGLSQDPRILDLGAGWGLTSEFLAMLGADVVAVDINPQFVELINRRATHRSLSLRAETGSFDDFRVDGKFDLAFFYESLHHAVRPWQVIERCAAHLKATGKIAFAAEPIQDIWWPHWGLRLDPVSIYCIRKFGWFESGWSQDFMTDMFRRIGLDLQLWPDAEAAGGSTGVAGYRIAVVSPESLKREWIGEGWLPDRDAFYSSGRAVLHPQMQPGFIHLVLYVVNYRSRGIGFQIIDQDGGVIQSGTMPCGHSEITVPAAAAGSDMIIYSDSWVPAEEFETTDRRTLSFNLERVLLSSIN